AVHAKGLLHRDVKPQNIMIHELTGEAVLIDFGIARELTQNPSKTHTSIVSEGYAPIEQYLPKAQRSAATDIYGMAATLYTLLTGEIPVAAVLRDRNPLVPLRQLRPDVSAAAASAIEHGMAIELKDRPQSVGRWIASLGGTRALSVGGAAGGATGGAAGGAAATSRGPKGGSATRVQQPNSEIPNSGIRGPVATPSEFPTRVVSPAYAPVSSATGGKTVAVPLPDEARTVAGSDAEPKAEKSGCGCLSSLAMATVGVAATAGIFGFWLTDWFSNLPKVSLPEVGLPEVVLEDKGDLAEDETAEDGEELPEEDADSEAEETLAKKPKKKPVEAETSEGAEGAEGDGAAGAVPDVADSSVGDSTGGRSLPLVLSSTGNPANNRPGDVDTSASIPGFSPGDRENQIRSRLGDPTQSSVVEGFQVDVYELVPNRVTLAYAYESGSNQVSQSEATFSPGTDFLKMRTAFSNMTGGASSEMVEGLRSVQSGAIDRFEFDRRNFSGVIERNAYGHIHVYVR
ncbi:MAG: protein kinase, partial [Cyanobacteria bacterium J06560_2]